MRAEKDIFFYLYKIFISVKINEEKVCVCVNYQWGSRIKIF